LNGVDVTSRAFYADTRRGIVRMYRVDIHGKKYLERSDLDHLGEIAKEERRGLVRLIREAS